jgi:hypothetical protein
MTFFNVMTMSIVHDSSTNLKQLKMVYNSNTITRDIYTNATNRWINIELLAKSGQVMKAYAWDYETFTLEPTAIFEFTSLAVFTNASVILLNSNRKLLCLSFDKISEIKSD